MDTLEKQKYIFGSSFLLANKLQAIGDQYIYKDDMTTKQWFLTVMILQFGNTPPTLSEIADIMGSSRQNVKQLSLKLEKKGFLKIEKDEKDARAIRLRLTERNQAFWEKRQDVMKQFLTELFEDLSKDQIDSLHLCINKLYERVLKMEKKL